MEVTKPILVDAIIGCGIWSSIADEMRAKGLARWCGDQYNEDWEWCRDALERLDMEALEKLYERARRQ